MRFSIIGCVAATSIALFTALGINRGLDLRGGEHLILRVMTDDAVRGETDRAIQTLGPGVHAMRIGNDRIDIAGLEAATVLAKLPDWEAISRAQLRLRGAKEAAIRSDAVDQTIQVVRNRLDRLGVGDVFIQPYGPASDYEILAELPGVDNPDRVRSIIKASAILEFKLVDAGPFPDPASANQSYNGVRPSYLDVLPDNTGRYYAVEQTAQVSGTDLKSAYVTRDENGHPAVGFALTADGARRFGDLTERHIGRFLAVVLDGRIQSAAQIEARITDSGIIRGGGPGFTSREASDLVLVLKSGALPASVQYDAEELVGPSLGADSIDQGVVASLVALAAVVTFMLFYYRWSGLNAVIAMLLNLAILFGSMAYFRATLTLPGIAGIILTIGVGIDSNVLVFERIREEIRAGHAPASAVSTAFRRVFVTLVDTHLAALISAAVLFICGTGAIQGFAVTLVIGLVSNMFTSIFMSRTFFDWTLTRRRGSDKLSI
jgi:preprotein translocase subunit SecD